jgi:hypothetical protein
MNMKRDIQQELRHWKTQSPHLPILLRGARQVGKSYVIEHLGKSEFENYLTVNFEQRPDAKQCFETLEPTKIIRSLELLYNVKLNPGHSLLFLDEMQECPPAIMALRYFKEQMPTLHIIGAGSLLEFILHETDFRMPVGRIQMMYLKPLNFIEFLEALQLTQVREELTRMNFIHPLPPVIHEQLLMRVQEYAALGGMPAVLSEYCATQDLRACQITQTSLLHTYRNDFGKYAQKTQHKYLQLLFDQAPALIAQWFKYSKVDPEVQPRDLKMALEKLRDAGLLHLIHATHATGLPLTTPLNQKKFKLLFLDIGLAKRAHRLDLPLLLDSKLHLLNQGMITEQFVGQELLSYATPYETPQLYFWMRDKKGSTAEIDYITTVDSTIIPIEVKSGATGKLKSLHLFMEEKNAPIGIRISQAPLSYHDKILSIPFYLIREIPRLVRACLNL